MGAFRAEGRGSSSAPIRKPQQGLYGAAGPTTAHIRSVIAIPDPVQRNLAITQAYHDLKLALTRLLGSRNVSWCAYATWASKTAGAFIRKERMGAVPWGSSAPSAGDHPRRGATSGQLPSLLERLPSEWVVARLWEEATSQVARNVALGNYIVFAEMAPLYAQLLELFAPGDAPDQAKLARLLGQLRPGPIEAGGQDYLIRAFSHYYRAIFTPSPKARAELILLANLLVGYHEQTRLQGPIIGAMEAPVEVLRGLDAAQVLPEVVPASGYRALADSLRPLSRRITAEWRAALTRWMMTLDLPGERLDLGRNIPPLTSGQIFPAELTGLHHPELITLLLELVRTPHTSRGSAARDWGSLADRMNFVVDFFRSRQQHSALYRQPFTDAQVARIYAGEIPLGPL